MTRELLQQALEALYSEDVDQQSWAKTALMKALAQPVQPTTGCACKWDGVVYESRCKLHEGWYVAIHEWAERAKTAEAKLAQPVPPSALPINWAGMIHYPDCWDTAAYPALRDAIHECLALSGCSTCKPAQPVPPAVVLLARFEEAVGDYWDCAYREGRLNRADGNKANAILHEIRSAVHALVALAQPLPGTQMWITSLSGKSSDLPVEGFVILDKDIRTWAQARGMHLMSDGRCWHVMISETWCTVGYETPLEALEACRESGKYADLSKCRAAKAKGELK